MAKSKLKAEDIHPHLQRAKERRFKTLTPDTAAAFKRFIATAGV